MKNVILLLLVFNSHFLCAQLSELPKNETGKYELLNVIELKGTASKIYSSVLISLTDVFNKSDKIIEYKDENEGVVIGKFIVETSYSGMGPKTHYFRFKIRIDVKDNKYRIQINNIGHEAIWTTAKMECSCINDIVEPECGSSGCFTNKEWNAEKIKAHNQTVLLIRALKKQIESNLQSITEGSKDW